MRLELKDTLKHRGVGRTLLLSILFFTSMSATADALFEATGYGNFEVRPDEVRFHTSVTRVKVDATEAQNEVNAIVLRLEKTVDRMASAVNSSISDVVSVTEITERSPAPMRGEMRIAAATLADSPSPVSAAALSYRAQVTVSANGD